MLQFLNDFIEWCEDRKSKYAGDLHFHRLWERAKELKKGLDEQREFGVGGIHREGGKK